MSAALQLPYLFAAASPRPLWPGYEKNKILIARTELELDSDADDSPEENEDEPRPHVSLAFYRKHAENMLRRYLYASMVVGRTPSVMDEPVRGGRATCTKMRTFEDAVVFVLDMEKCLAKLAVTDRTLLTRIVLQEYTHTEVSLMLGISIRKVLYRTHVALDKMTELLMDAGMLDLPQH